MKFEDITNVQPREQDCEFEYLPDSNGFGILANGYYTVGELEMLLRALKEANLYYVPSGEYRVWVDYEGRDGKGQRYRKAGFHREHGDDIRKLMSEGKNLRQAQEAIEQEIMDRLKGLYFGASNLRNVKFDWHQ